MVGICFIGKTFSFVNFHLVSQMPYSSINVQIALSKIVIQLKYAQRILCFIWINLWKNFKISKIKFNFQSKFQETDHRRLFSTNQEYFRTVRTEMLSGKFMWLRYEGRNFFFYNWIIHHFSGLIVLIQFDFKYFIWKKTISVIV